jgi:hypothetical protein
VVDRAGDGDMGRVRVESMVDVVRWGERGQGDECDQQIEHESAPVMSSPVRMKAMAMAMIHHPNSQGLMGGLRSRG